MFFIGVFGIENKDKEIKTLDNINCKSCNKTIVGKLNNYSETNTCSNCGKKLEPNFQYCLHCGAKIK